MSPIGGENALLFLILGAIYTTKGDIRVSQKITPLELGAGFHPDLTGRENILINGVLLGLTKDEVSERMEEIIAFSEIGEFIDMPVRTYSSGMYLRLAFSVAIHTDPKILLIDEVFAVGDEAFQKKCVDKINEFRKQGKTIIFVSHDLNAVRSLCQKSLLLNEGNAISIGDTEKVINDYLTLLQGK